MDSLLSTVFSVKYPEALCLWDIRWEESNMKKWKTVAALALVAVALVGSTTAYAAGYGGGHRWSSRDSGDTWSAACPNWNSCWRDTDGDGICDLCGRAGPGYVDADGDGICDNYGIGRAGGGHHGVRHCRW